MQRRGPIRVLLPGLLGGSVLALLVASLSSVVSTPTRAPRLAALVPAARTETVSELRPVRVLIHSEVEELRIESEHGLRVRDGQGRVLGTLPPGRLPLRAVPGSDETLRLGSAAFPANELLLSGVNDAALTVTDDDTDRSRSERRFPGALRIRARGGGRFDVVNEVDVETYVSCVVAGETWPTFDDEAIRAQAIAARTYVVYQMMRREPHPFDVAATQASQVYRGARQDDIGRRAAEAVRYTRGVLCTYEDRGTQQVFCAYYSAACGGLSQPAGIFGSDGEIAPLAGGVRCDYCKIAPADFYRWGPVRIPKSELARRLSARNPEVAALEGIRRIDVLERTTAGRPTVLRLHGESGATLDLLAERFRHAVGPTELRSTDFQLKDQGAYVVFENGRGFGHGLGLCQWGAEGQARLGRHASDILRHYYPGAKLTKGY